MASYRSISARREPIATGIFEYTQTEEFATAFAAFSPSKIVCRTGSPSPVVSYLTFPQVVRKEL